MCLLIMFLCLLNNKKESVPTGVKREWRESPLPKCMLHCPSQADPVEIKTVFKYDFNIIFFTTERKSYTIHTS